MGMLNVTELLVAEVANRVRVNYAVAFGGVDCEHLQLATRGARSALARIATSDALYHNVEHTVHVTLVGLQILLGKQILDGDVTPRDWLTTSIALLCHDIGYVRGACANDAPERVATGRGPQTTWLAEGASDAALMPLHVDRGKLYVHEQYAQADTLLDIAAIQSCIERTRFPVPKDPWYALTGDYPGLVRGADLIGQLSDPRYLNKLAALFFEFEENGYNATTGYRKPGDLLTAYPAFFDCHVAPYVTESVRYLQQTRDGREMVGSLYRNLDLARRPAPARAAARPARPAAPRRRPPPAPRRPGGARAVVAVGRRIDRGRCPRPRRSPFHHRRGRARGLRPSRTPRRDR